MTTSLTAQDLQKKDNSLGYHNWLAVGKGLDILCDGLRHHAERKMKELHNKFLLKLGTTRCLCPTATTSKSNPHLTTCMWATELKNFHARKINASQWNQSDSSKWHDPVDGYWELAKLFMPNLGKNASNVKDLGTTDPTGLLNLMIFCKHFNVQINLLEVVRNWRNTLAHSPGQELSEADKKEAFEDILNLMVDRELLSCKEVQDCRTIVENVRDDKVSILREDELKVLQEMRALRELEFIDRSNSERQSQNVNTLGLYWSNFCEGANIIFVIFLTIVFSFFCLFSQLLKWVFILSIMVSGIGDKSTMLLDNRCPRTSEKSPIHHRFKFQEFNFSSYLVYKGEQFLGRQWLFNELEDSFDVGHTGVLITAEPGSGKTALMSRLVCSPFSSLFIHDNIIGYHLCDSAAEGKRNGGMFVRNLVEQIAGRLSQYSDRIGNDEQIQRMLEKTQCERYPTECFIGSIIEPLRDLDEPDGHRYILVDALDECLDKDGKTSAILDMLSSKMSYFPKWLKVILTSRNWTVVTGSIPQTVKRIPLNATDERNIEDIRSYIQYILSKKLNFKDRLLEAINLKSTIKDLNSLVDELVNKGEGNFLVVKITLQYLEESDGIINFESFPTSLDDTYNIFFKRHFTENNPFYLYRPVFEILLATKSPLQIDEISAILKRKNSTQDISELIKHLFLFLRFGEDGAVALYHQTLAEWLIRQASRSGDFGVSKSKGHQYIADFILDRSHEEKGNLTLNELSELCSHIIQGGNEERHKQELRRFFNVSQIQDPSTGRSILHKLAVKNNATHLLEIFIGKFKSVDIRDSEGKSPAFYAASEGKDDNLELFIRKGANVDSVYTKFLSKDPIEILFQNEGVEEYSMMHVAAYRGHNKIIELLLNNNVKYPKKEKIPTPLQLAAGNGHLDVVKLLHNQEKEKDHLISLHHAAARNHSSVVEYLLQNVGVSDHCVSCKLENVPFPIENATVNNLHQSFCETALHAAVSRGYLHVVRVLLNFSTTVLECKHRSGKTPLMDAVERNDTDMVNLLIKADAVVEEQCGDKKARSLNEEMCQLLSVYMEGFLYTLYCDNDNCPCGNIAVHFAAINGFWNIGLLLLGIEGDAQFHSKNCKGIDALKSAVMFDQAQFIHKINNTGRIAFKDEWMILEAARCGSSNVLRLFQHEHFNLELENLGFTPLSRTVFWSPYPKNPECLSCSEYLNGNSFLLANKINEESRKRKATIKFLVKSQEIYEKYSFINKKDKNGMTALHYAAVMGFVDAVECLVNLGGNESIRDNDGRTPLELATIRSPMPKATDTYYRCYTTTDGVFTTCNTTCYDATVAYLILLQKSNIQICDSKSGKLLYTVITKRMPLSLYSLLKIGVDMNCKGDHGGFYPFQNHLLRGGKEIGEVFKIFGYDVSIKCGTPFINSELHLMSYLSATSNVGNFFKPSINKRPFPLQKLLDKNPKGFHIFDECRDLEGYLAIHRAAQGGNIDAINWFLSLGVDMSQRTLSGLTALDISIIYLGEHSHIKSKMLYSLVDKSTPLSSEKYRHQIFEKLLSQALKSEKYKSVFKCGASLGELSPLHIAALIGVKTLNYVHRKAAKIAPGTIPMNCSNKHWVNPQYFAYFYESIRSNSDKESKKAICGNIGGYLQYPDREAEYHIIYNYFYQSPTEIENRLFYALLPKLENFDVIECPGFYDFLPWRKKKAKNAKNEEDGKASNGDETEIICLSRIPNCSPSSSKMIDVYRPQNVCTFQERLRDKQFARKHYCPHITELLQDHFTSKPRKNRKVSEFIAERMRWTDSSDEGDVLSRWPFYFFYNKLKNKYEEYKYLEALNSALEMHDEHYAKRHNVIF